MKKRALTLFFLPCLLPLAAFAYDINGVALGGKEIEVKKAFPSAHCKPLEWKSDAADRRCDDARISLGGVEARITVFLKGGAIQAWTCASTCKDLERVKEYAARALGRAAGRGDRDLRREGRQEGPQASSRCAGRRAPTARC